MKNLFALSAGTFAALFVAVLVAPVAVAQDGAAQTVRVERQAPRVGDVRTETGRQVVEITMGGQVLSKEIKSVTKQIEILETDAEGKISKAKVTYKSATQVAIQPDPTGAGDDQKLEMDAPFAGKTYILTRSGDDEIQVTDAEGNEAPFEEIMGVREDNSGFDSGPEMLDELAGRDLKVGEEIAFPQKMIDEFEGESGNEMETATMVVQGAREVGSAKCVVFALKLVMSANTPAGTVKFTLAGELVVQANTGWPVKLSLSGPLELNMEGQKITGTFENSAENTYSRSNGDND